MSMKERIEELQGNLLSEDLEVVDLALDEVQTSRTSWEWSSALYISRSSAHVFSFPLSLPLSISTYLLT